MVRKELADELPPVRGNESRLQQVFFNLVMNARDAMPSGGWLTLRTSLSDDDTLVVEVGDTGHGIRREDMRRIYDPFFTTKGNGPRDGLGSVGLLRNPPGARRRDLRRELARQGDDLPGRPSHASRPRGRTSDERLPRSSSSTTRR